MKAVLLLLVACLLACSALVIESRKIDSLPRRSKASKALESTRLYTVDPLVSTPIVLSAVDAKEQGTATVASSTFNLGKCILGAGILSLPGGVAKFSDSASGLGPASALLLIMGLISGYTFKSIGKACSIHGVDTFAEAWGESVDKKSAPAVLSIVTFKTFFACLAYSIIIGDTFTSIFVSSGLSPALATRSNVIIALSSTVLLPLCSLKNLDALKYTSILGLLGTLYTAAFMVIRYLDGSYVEGGQFFGAVSEALRPSFDARTTPGSPLAIFVLISMISTAYVAHYNAPKFFSELKEKTMTNYNKIVTMGFGASIALYFVVMWVGFLQFGGHCSGFILNNYATADKLATAARVAIGTGILCGYPLTFSALRDGVLDLARVKKADQRGVLIPVTVVLLALLTVGALLLDNVGKVVSFSGALIGSLLIYIIPATMNIFNIRRAATTSTSTSGVTYTPAQKAELLLNVLIALSGITVAVFGVAINLMS